MTPHPASEADLVLRATRRLMSSTLWALVLIDRVAVQAGGAQQSLGGKARGLVPMPRAHHDH